jgi:TonB family protein
MKTPVPFYLSFVLLAVPAAAQDTPRDQPPAFVEAARQEAQLVARIAAEGLTPQFAMDLATHQENRGAGAEAETTLVDARKLFPADRSLISALARYYTRHGKGPEAIEVLEQLARLEPGDRLSHQTVATFYEEIVRKGQLSPDDKRAFILRGIAAADRALALDAEYVEALVYKNILLRHQSMLEPDAARRQRLIVEADGLRAQAIELRERQSATAPLGGATDAVPPPPPPPPPPGPPRPPCVPGSSLLTQPPVRVGGNIKPPSKVRDVPPVYPPNALSARVQGVVILEATIAEDGRVVGACVLRSVPLVDEAAVEAVKQWEFTQTFLNGMAVPVVMTVTVNFVLQ